jgi:hypothetical protein
VERRKRGGRPESVKTELATEPIQADRFSKARSARSASMLEDYTELIADLIAANGEARTTDIARRLGVAHPTLRVRCNAARFRGLLARARAALEKRGKRRCQLGQSSCPFFY